MKKIDMKLIKLFIKVVCKVLIFPLYIIMYFVDDKVIERISKKRFSLTDARPHILIIILMVALYCGYRLGIYNIDLSKIAYILPTWLYFQGILFAASTFILSIFNPKKIKNDYPNKDTVIDDIVDDLKRANMIIFIVLVYIFILFFGVSDNIIKYNYILIIIGISFSFWSLGAIESIIKGIFDLINIE
jgi:hypothetical protein